MIYVGIDCGTQGTKAVLWDARRHKIISSAYQSYEVISSRHGQKEQDPEEWIKAVQHTVKQAIYEGVVAPHQVAAIGVSGQQHGLVLLDSDNHLLRPAKLWCDTEPVDALRQFLTSFKRRHQQELHAFTGINTPVAFTIAKLLWVRDHQPDIFARIEKILLPHEYINFWLTGSYRAECGDASGTGYFDTLNRSWCKTVVDEISPQLYQKLPKLINSQQPAGLLKAETAELLGLAAGLPVSSGGGDNMMAAIGTDNISPGVLTLSLGTSGTLFTYADRQLESENQKDINCFCSSSNGWLPLISTMNVTNAVNAFRQAFNIPLAEFESLVNSSPPGSGGLTCYPWFNGSRYPDVPDATASLHGITRANFSPANLLRCVVEGVSFKICKGIEEFRQQSLDFTQIRVIGGGAKSQAWCQMIADITGLEVIRPPITEAAAFGAALQAQWCHENYQQSIPTLKLSDVMPGFLLQHHGEVFTPDNHQHAIYQALSAAYHKKLQHAVQLNRQSGI